MDNWEDILEAINNEKFEYISFDIFDTLLLRPFWEPSDLFFFTGFIAKEMNLVKSEYDFLKIRKNAEINLRYRMRDIYQDISLNEIYDYINKNNIRTCDVDKLKQNEKDMELYFCYRRNSGYELYKEALKCNKKVILISDMYLDKSDIDNILINNGYQQIYRTYISSEIRLGKYTGDLFKYVKKDLSINEKNILHIGDNYKADVIKAKENGFNSCYLPKAKDVYLSNEKQKQLSSLKLRIIKGIEANLKWDNPFYEQSSSNLKNKYEDVFSKFSLNIENCKVPKEIPEILKKIRALISYKLN